jgi:hypothetical protein
MQTLTYTSKPRRRFFARRRRARVIAAHAELRQLLIFQRVERRKFVDETLNGYSIVVGHNGA